MPASLSRTAVRRIPRARRSPIQRRAADALRGGLCAAAVLAAFSFAANVLAQGGAEHPPSAAEQRAAAAAQARAVASSNALLGAMKALERAPAAQRAQRTQDVMQAVQQRRQALLEVVRTDPQRALTLALPDALRERLPKEAREQIEQRVELEGRVIGMSIDDHERGIARHPYFLETVQAGHVRRFGLQWADPAMSERDALRYIDRHVRVKALRVNGYLVVGDRGDVEMSTDRKGGGKKDPSGSGSTSGDGGSLDTLTGTLVAGEQRTLVILASFSDRATSCTASGVQSALFGTGSSVDRIYRESSDNQVTFSGDVVGPFTIPYSAGGSCDFNGWGAAADSAARAAGIDPSRYTRISYAVPPNGNCGWTGIAYVGGTPPTRSWVAQCTAGIFAHEIGHNLRFKHASTPTSEYGDGSDPMGSAPAVQMHAANRIMAGWLPATSIVDGPASGTYSIAALEAPDTGAPQAIRLRKSDTGEYYYVSLRQAAALDANLSSAYRDVVTVHRATGTMPSPTMLVARLGAGQSFNDTANGIRVTAQSISTGMASVDVQTTTAACTRAAPVVQASPSSQTGAPGATLRYSVSITNRNGSTCASSVFALAQSIPSGFSGSFAAPSVTLAPGASTTVSWSVSSAAQATDGVYAVRASAAESGSSAASAQASYLVYSDASAPTVSVDWPTDGAVIAGKPTSLSASAYDAGGISRVDFLVNGKSVGYATTAPYQVRWNAKKSKGTNTLTARAIDTTGNASEATVRFTVK